MKIKDNTIKLFYAGMALCILTQLYLGQLYVICIENRKVATTFAKHHVQSDLCELDVIN